MIFDGQTICLYKNLFEVNCLGCGITRAIFLVFEGDIFGAYGLNPGVLIVFPILFPFEPEYMISIFLLTIGLA